MASEDVKVVRLHEFAGDVGCHLRRSWRKGVRLLVTIDGEGTPLAIDTVGDLEVVHKALGWATGSCDLAE